MPDVEEGRLKGSKRDRRVAVGERHITAMRSCVAYHETFGTWYVPNLRTLRIAPGGDWLFQTNSIGISDSREFARHADPDTTRILLFGDSFTVGLGVAVADRYSSLMEAQRPGTEVINFGLEGSGTDVHLLLYEHLGREYESDVLMVNPHVSNITRNAAPYQMRQDSEGERFLISKPYFSIEDDRLLLHKVPVPKERVYEGTPAFNDLAETIDPDPLADPAAGHGRGSNTSLSMRALLGRVVRQRGLDQSGAKYSLVRVVPVQPFPQYDSPDDPAWLLMCRLLRRFAEGADERAVVCAPLPGWYHVFNPSLAISYLDRFGELAASVDGMHVIDVLPYFLELPFRERLECFLPRGDDHYTRRGHEVVANALLAELAERGIVAARSEILGG